MSRLRKGKKYKGAGFADHFKSACAMKSPLYAKADHNVSVAGSNEETPTEEIPTKQVEEDRGSLEQSSAAEATIKNLGPDDIAPKTGSTSRNQAREDWVKGNKAKAKDAAEAKAAKAAEEKAIADELAGRTYETESGETAFVDDYEEGSSGKERRGEHRDNKGEIKDLRKSGEISRKEAREHKKTSRKLKKSNRKATKAEKKKAKRARKGK